MAASYWQSTQRRDWLFTREQLAHLRHEQERDDDGNPHLAKQYPLPETRILSLFFHAQLLKLAKRMSIRQPVIATAQVYLRRFYTRVPVRSTNPYLLLATALYVACKIEEYPQNIRIVVGEARSIWQEFIGPEVAALGEVEFWLISTLGCELIVHHPYKTLRVLEAKLGLASEEAALAGSVINDAFATDLPLLCAPHVVAWAAVFMALAFRPAQGAAGSGSSASAGGSGGGNGLRDGLGMGGQGDVAEVVARALRSGTEPAVGATGLPNGQQGRLHMFLEWLAESEIDIRGVADCMQEIISLYVVWDSFKEKEVRDQIGRFVKGRGLDR